MKSLISIVNVTGDSITRFGVEFAPGVPVMVYRSRRFLELGEQFGRLVADLSAGSLVGFDFSGVANSPAQSIETLNAVVNEFIASSSATGYSPLRDWYRLSSADILDGLRGQILTFDWSDPAVVVDRDETLSKLAPVVAYLSAGLLDLATVLVDAYVPDGPADFISPGRVALYRSLFHSAEE